MNKGKAIAIVGPTASGKSALGTYLAQKLRGGIISADSRQVYKGMRIISRAEPGHMVGVADPRRSYSAGAYAKEAARAYADISQKNKMPIVVGGAGFYTDAFLRAPLPSVAPNKKRRAALAKKTSGQLFALLKKLDPISAKRVDPRNRVRMIRAIEIAETLGAVPPREHGTRYDTLWLGLAMPAQYEKILRRGVELRLKQGMLKEAQRLRAALPKKRYGELGFEFDLLAQLLDRKISRQEFIEKMVRGELKYAKRQIRWFKRNNDIHWVKNKTEALRLAKTFLSG